jgi:hypothetical protein
VKLIFCLWIGLVIHPKKMAPTFIANWRIEMYDANVIQQWFGGQDFHII